jgi:3-oxoacyl-[acyl-carrier protein] reductase
MEIQEQVVLVTGERGLGLAISQALLKQGARVVVNYLNSHSAAQDLQQQFPNQVLIYQADITQADQVLAMFKAAKHHFGSGITSVVNNALIKFEFNGKRVRILKT